MKPLWQFRRRTRRLRLLLILAAITWSLMEVLQTKWALLGQLPADSGWSGDETIYITGMHWNDEQILRDAWIPALVDLANAIGRDRVFVSIYESGSWDDTKGALRLLDSLLAQTDIPRRIVMDHKTHLAEINQPPEQEGDGWIETRTGGIELRRVPYLAKLRNEALRPLYELRDKGIVYDKILFLNDVVFSTADVQRLLATRDGQYAAACSLDFSKPPNFYDTFALRDSEGHDRVMQAWPYFRSRASRQAMKNSQPVPVTSCWNGIVAMDPSPFYAQHRLQFRAISDSLAKFHLEGSECCLIHADNPLSKTSGVWLNPNVRVGYSPAAYAAVNPADTPWLSTFSIIWGMWQNRLLRWFTSPWFSENTIKTRIARWENQDPRDKEPGPFCLIDEMQILTMIGWVHV